MIFIPDDLYAAIEASMPIVCVDFVFIQRAEGSISRVGLIKRESPYGVVWCHLGGRIQRGETIAQAIGRHLEDTLVGAEIEIGMDPQPVHTFQWFPSALAPRANLVFGADERKHSIGLSFVFEGTGIPKVVPGGEALAFQYFPVGKLPDDLWPGCSGLLEKLLPRLAT